MIDTFSLGDKVILKKPHACGENLWEIVRVGADVKLKCAGCGRVVMLDRLDFLKLKCAACGRVVMLDRLEFLKRAKKLVPSEKDEEC